MSRLLTVYVRDRTEAYVIATVSFSAIKLSIDLPPGVMPAVVVLSVGAVVALQRVDGKPASTPMLPGTITCISSINAALPEHGAWRSELAQLMEQDMVAVFLRDAVGAVTIPTPNDVREAVNF